METLIAVLLGVLIVLLLAVLLQKYIPALLPFKKVDLAQINNSFSLIAVLAACLTTIEAILVRGLSKEDFKLYSLGGYFIVVVAIVYGVIGFGKHQINSDTARHKIDADKAVEIARIQAQSKMVTEPKEKGEKAKKAASEATIE